MAHDPNNQPPPAPQPQTQPERSSGAQWFIIGGLVVAVVVIALFLFSGDNDSLVAEPTVESSQPAATPAAPEPAPASDGAAVEGGAAVDTQ